MTELTIRECFDLMADAHMQVFGMKNSPARETAWATLNDYLTSIHSRDAALSELGAERFGAEGK